MSKTPFNKQPLTYVAQLDLLKQRGLIVENEPKALHLLEVISYYRLSGYWYPLLADKEQHKFKKDATFETAFNLYKFDRELRLLITGKLEKIEIAIRAKMIYVLVHSKGPFWYCNPNNFKNQHSHYETLKKIRSECDRSDADFLKSFKLKYTDELPPCWMILETTSFGILSNLYGNLINGRDKRDVANYFGLSELVFTSWLHSIVYLRNICAHHSRLWNRELQIQPVIPNSPKHPFLTTTTYFHPDSQQIIKLNNKTYFFLSLIYYLLRTINPKNSFKEKLLTLISKYPNVDVRAMGFPSEWIDEPLWSAE